MIKKRLIKLLSHAKKYILEQVIWQWLSLICQMLMIYSIAMLLNMMLASTIEQSKIAWYVGISVGAMICRFLFDRMASYASYKASVDVKKILRENIYRKLLRLGVSYRESVSTSEIIQMAVEGVEQLEIYFGKYLAQLIYSLVAPLTLFIVLSFLNFKASLILLICVPMIPLSIVLVQKIAKRLLSKYWGIYTGLGDSFLENLQGLTTLKIYQADEESSKKMDIESQKFRKATMRVLTMQLNSTSVMDIIAYGGAGIGMIVVLKEFSAGNVGFAGTMMIILLASEFFIPLRLLGSFFHIAMNGMAASDKIFALLDLPTPEEKTLEIRDDSLEISLEDIKFSYVEDREILKGVDMTFEKGTFTSLVGVSGSGKSTIAKLLMGRNHGYKGNLKINGMELSEIDEKSLMGKITCVSHNSYLFKGTVEDNLRMGKADATGSEMRNVLEKVNLLGFVDAQNGLQTKILANASNFSGGQRQRLSLARALLHDTPVYIFDEATSNIDMESEELIMDVIHELAKTKTIILISHRLANVVKSDKIYMLKDGKIVQNGTHDELMAQGGAYKELYEYQKSLEDYAHLLGQKRSGVIKDKSNATGKGSFSDVVIPKRESEVSV
ncbi:MAG: ABC transporter ATP-binding protein/permease [Peptostreptococcaceae bacterium]|nr:ABC transporter ATP-binding protein/permease [Peptostreptococcaceae bacterium]